MYWKRSGNRQPEKAAVSEWCDRSAKIVVISVLALLLPVAGCGFPATGADRDKTQEALTGAVGDKTPEFSTETGGNGTQAASDGAGEDRIPVASDGAGEDRIPVASTGAGEDKVPAASVAAESAAKTESETVREGEKTEILLEHIEWQDYYNNDAEWNETKLFFTFSNGESAELAVMYSPSIVEKIEYEDITGDGTAEVLVYRYFANTATEYTLIDFIEVKDGIVKNISPETDIAELTDEVWNTVIEDFSVDGYACPVLRMESFGKESCIAYLDRVYLV